MKEISEMTAEELRLEIARAKGWTIYGEGTDSQMITPPISDERRYYTAEWDENGFPDYAPNWPDDIAAAWELVEEGSEHWEIIVGASCCASVSSIHLHNEIIGTGDFAPLAICRAWLALKAAL